MTAVAVAQLAPVIGEPERNRQAAAGAIGEAASAGAELIGATGAARSGYVFADEQEARALATADDSPTLRQWQELAAARHTVIVGGSASWPATDDCSTARPGSTVSGRGGLPQDPPVGPGRPDFTRAAPPRRGGLPFGQVAVMICYDLEIPEWARLPPWTAPTSSRPGQLAGRPCRRAAREGRQGPGRRLGEGVVAVADRCGPERGVEWISGSVIVGPDGYRAGPPWTPPGFLLAGCDCSAPGQRLNDHNDLPPTAAGTVLAGNFGE